VFFFVVILALAGFMGLLEWRRRKPAFSAALEGAAARKAAWGARRERVWVVACCLASALFIMAITAEFLYARASTSLSVALPISVVDGVARIPVSQVNDGNLHRFAIEADGTHVRVIVIARPDKTLAVAFDACMICGPQGYYQKGPNVICRHCSSAIFVPSIGTKGGCNPVPLVSSIEGADLVIPAASLFGGKRLFQTAGS
jgi:high-affinity iron transporter